MTSELIVTFTMIATIARGWAMIATEGAKTMMNDALERASMERAKPMQDCPFPRCEDCDKYHGRYCTVPMVVSKQKWLLTEDLLVGMEKRLSELENLVTDEILRSDKGITIPPETELNVSWDEYLKGQK